MAAIAALISLLDGSALATLLNWSSTFFAENLDSRGVNLGNDFRFELGVFSPGFLPTSGNVEEWAAHWVALSTANYNVADSAVTGEASTSATVSGQAYIWGFNQRTGSKREWVLIVDRSWFISGTGDDDVEMPVTLSIGGTCEAVLGSINEGGTHIRTSAVSPSQTTPATWRAQFLAQASATNAAWDADPDGDGVCNALEYVFGSNPTDRNSCRQIEVSCDLGSRPPRFILRVPRNSAAVAEIRIEASPDLRSWIAADDCFEVIAESNEETVLREKGDAVRCRFIRVRSDVAPR